ncbi:HAMP domain-containing histidine kinase [Sulfurospirillum sp. T05]|uniref:histidine kinase n=1 Tax=Sulfurospirillum tamanense TaxID=2813362 RepID=A0ABS2WTP0_9BACT|nr:HAMP domain-containing sensor histidine kinase [Sulfurospirillum tamanensis]MBN2965024.1 HAMP domain-containing histidine kinase [Sulfurospirillum tamanensis]
MEIILFIYGLAFFVLGILAFFVKTKQSQIFFAKKIWLLGAFGISHALVEWVFLYSYVKPQLHDVLIAFKSFFLVISYFFLFEFSRFIIRESFKHKQHPLHFLFYLYDSRIIYPISITNFFILVMLDPSYDGIISAVRYTYGFFGSLFLGIGLYFYGESLKKTPYAEKLKLYFKIPGVAFIFYAFIAIIAVYPTNYFPGNTFNAAWFLETFGFPVQFFRAFCAIIITACSVKALQIFNEEVDLKLTHSLSQIKRFSSDVSHELKTPLTSIKGELEIALKKNRTAQEYQNTLSSALEGVNTLQSIVKNLLMLAYMEKKSLAKHFTRNQADDIVLKCIEELWPVASKKQIDLHVNDLENTPVLCDELLLQQVFFNLIENAIKYSPKDTTITLSLTRTPTHAKLVVSDNGPGVSEDKIAHLFDRFYRCDEARSRNVQGYGLGLSIAKQIILAHTGTITAHNHATSGLVVVVTLPLATNKN